MLEIFLKCLVIRSSLSIVRMRHSEPVRSTGCVQSSGMGELHVGWSDVDQIVSPGSSQMLISAGLLSGAIWFMWRILQSPASLPSAFWEPSAVLCVPQSVVLKSKYASDLLQRWERDKCLVMWIGKGTWDSLFLMQTSNLSPCQLFFTPPLVWYLVPLVSEPPTSTGQTSVLSICVLLC